MINSFLVYNNNDKLIMAYSNPSISFYKLYDTIFVFEVGANKYHVNVEENFKIQMDAPICLVIKGDKNNNEYKLDFTKKNTIASEDFS